MRIGDCQIEPVFCQVFVLAVGKGTFPAKCAFENANEPGTTDRPEGGYYRATATSTAIPSFAGIGRWFAIRKRIQSSRTLRSSASVLSQVCSLAQTPRNSGMWA